MLPAPFRCGSGVGLRMKHIPIDLLRTFMILVETKSFTEAGERVGRSQSTVSLQIRKLVELCDAPLFSGSGKDITLTQTGRHLADYGRRIIDLNDECIRIIEGRSLAGRIRIGIPSDFAISFLPPTLGRFSADFPDVSLEVTCQMSSSLLRQLDEGKLDVVVALEDGRNSSYLQAVWRDPMVWVGRLSLQVSQMRPLPLVLFTDECAYRSNILHVLRRESIPYRIAFSSQSMAGNQSAIEAGLGITALSLHSIPHTMQQLPENAGLPMLPFVNIGLFWNPRGSATIIRSLAEFLRQVLNAKLGGDGGQGAHPRKRK